MEYIYQTQKFISNKIHVISRSESIKFLWQIFLLKFQCLSMIFHFAR